jgi:2-polyprenyl-3-methyl-5-hydroxy-6-metoxy-1,4-benzoquinol methylase
MKNFCDGKSTESSKNIFESSLTKGKIEYENKYNKSMEDIKFSLGPWNTYHYFTDPKRMAFIFSRYKFVSKMFEGFNKVLEIGCQEGIGTPIIAQVVKNIVATDYYIPYIDSCNQRVSQVFQNIEFKGHDIIDSPVDGDFDGVFSLDVFEHIDPLQEHMFMQNITNSISKFGVTIIGTPSLESQVFASAGSKEQHINCKSGEKLRELCKQYYNNVFMFGMNDEIVHTGYLPMCQYLFAMCTSKKEI